MARKDSTLSFPFPALGGAAEADVSVAYLPPYIPGARPSPYFTIRFVSQAGATLSFPIAARTAATLLRYVNNLLKHSLSEFRELGIGDERNPTTNKFGVDANQHHHRLPGFRAARGSLATRDQLRLLRELAGLDPNAATAGEFPFIIIDVFSSDEELKPVEASLVMDLWAAAAFRDGLCAALSSAMPDKNQNDRPIQTVDGVVGSFGL